MEKDNKKLSMTLRELVYRTQNLEGEIFIKVNGEFCPIDEVFSFHERIEITPMKIKEKDPK